jgi:hypothetical protein
MASFWYSGSLIFPLGRCPECLRLTDGCRVIFALGFLGLMRIAGIMQPLLARKLAMGFFFSVDEFTKALEGGSFSFMLGWNLLWISGLKYTQSRGKLSSSVSVHVLKF